MKKYYPQIIFFLSLFLILGFVASANAACDPCPKGAFCNPLCAKSFEELLNIVVNIVFTISLAIAPILFILAGFYFVTAAGKPEQVETAKKMILWTVIGLIVIICSKGIINLFTEIMQVKK